MRRLKWGWPVLVLLAAMLGGTAGMTQVAHAAGTTYYANNESDLAAQVGDCSSPSNTDCSLRDAIAAATSGSDTIRISTGGTSTALQGGAYNLSHNVSIIGPGANILTIYGSNSGSTFTVNKGVTALISGITMSQGVSIIVNHGTLTLTNCAISAGFANPAGGGILNSGTLTLTGSTISGNDADYGAAIYSTGSMSITNSTIANNTAHTGGAGGIFNDGGTLTLTNSTITGNSSAAAPAGLYNNGTAKLINTLAQSNSPEDVDGKSLTTNSHNLIGGTPILGTLGGNGGPTQTVALLSGSAAIGAGDAAACAAAPVNGIDQRGVSRPASSCDIGAFQSQGLSSAGPPKSASPWIIGTTAVPGGYSILQRTSGGWSAVPGGAIHIAVGPDGQPWVVNSSSLIYHMVNGAWQQMPGTARDIAVGANGAVWIVGTVVGSGGYYPEVWNGSGWTLVSGGAVEIAVGPDGEPWVVNSSNNILHMSNGAWAQVPGSARDIAVGDDGSVWSIGTTTGIGGYGIYHWNGTSWIYANGHAVNIAVGPDGQPWVVNSSNIIYHLVNGLFQTVAGSAREIAIN